MNGKELDRKYKGDFPNECVAEKADTERLMNETGPLDGTKEATEDFRRDENGLSDMENPNKTGSRTSPGSDNIPPSPAET